ALESQPNDFNSQYGSTTNLETGLPDWFGAYVIVSGIVNLIVAILLLVGAIMVIMKKSAGLFMVIAGCALVIIAGVGGFIASSSITADLPDGGMSMAGSAVGLVLLMFPVATLVLAAVPPTARWCAQGNAPVAAPAFGQPGGMYPPSGGYGQPGQDPRHPGQAPQQW
ncbi:MAG: hypothetical protein ACRDQW_00495, partial [Haloechinothrix sp.]